jgi:hypothetical protein
MKAVGYILGLIFITGFSLASLVFFLTNTQPEMLKKAEFVMFYVSFFLAVMGSFTLLNIFYVKRHSAYRLNWKMIKPAFCRGTVFAIILTLILIFYPYLISLF